MSAASEPGDGGPAFPFINDGSHFPGMSLRDWFAGQVVAGAGRQPIFEGVAGRERHIKDVATFAYAIADAMLEARALRAARGG